MSSKKLLRYNQAGEILKSHGLGGTRQNVSDLVCRGRLPFVVKYGLKLISTIDLDKYIVETKARKRVK